MNQTDGRKKVGNGGFSMLLLMALLTVGGVLLVGCAATATHPAATADHNKKYMPLTCRITKGGPPIGEVQMEVSLVKEGDETRTKFNPATAAALCNRKYPNCLDKCAACVRAFPKSVTSDIEICVDASGVTKPFVLDEW